MSTALELIRTVEANGGQMRVENDCLVIAPEDAATPILDDLRRHKAEIIGLLQSRPASPAEAPIDEGWKLWLQERCVFRDHWWFGTGALYRDFARWCADRRQPSPESWRPFVAALRVEGFQITSDGLVYGLILKADLAIYERFQAAANPAKATTDAQRIRQRPERWLRKRTAT